MIYIRPTEPPKSQVARAKGSGITGHGPSWRTISLAIEMEMERSFKALSALNLTLSLEPSDREQDMGLPWGWFLGVDESRHVEIAAVARLFSQGKLLLTSEDETVVCGRARPPYRVSTEICCSGLIVRTLKTEKVLHKG